VSDDSDRVRLAELVAALSLGIDLGFGQGNPRSSSVRSVSASTDTMLTV
jgi:hypothetical protein